MKNKTFKVLIVFLIVLLMNGNNTGNDIIEKDYRLDNIIETNNKLIKNQQFERAILYLKNLVTRDEEFLKIYLMDIDYSLITLSNCNLKSDNENIFVNDFKFVLNKLENFHTVESNKKAYNYYCIGYVYSHLEEYNKSIKYLKLSYIEFEKNMNEDYLLYTSKLLFLIYSSLNDFSKAELFIDKSLFHLKNSKQIPELFKFDVWYSASVNAYKSDNYKLAIDRLDSSNKYLNFIRNEQKANLFNSYGLTYSKLDQYSKAEENFKKAINYRNIEIPVNILNLSKDYQNYSELLSKTGRVKEAIEMGNLSCDLITKTLGLKSGSTSRAFSSLGSIYIENKLFKKSIDAYNNALLSSSIDTLFEESKLFPDPSSVKFLPEYILALKGKAMTLKTMAGETGADREIVLNQSLVCYKEAIGQIEKLRNNFQFDEGKLLLSENERSVYNEAMEACYALYNITGNGDYINTAFEITEHSKASVLLEKVSLLSNLTEKGDFNTLFSFDQKLRKEISTLEKIIAEKKHTMFNKIKVQKIYLYKLYDIQEKFYSLLKNTYPEYYHMWLNPSFVTISQFQDKLNKDESFINYYMTDSSVFSIVISKEHKYFNRLACLNSDILDRINNYRKTICSYNFESSTVNGYRSFKEQSYGLYSMLLKPVKSQLNKSSVIISSDGILNFLPFETLIQEIDSSNEVDYRDLNYMVKNYQINYSYSATMLNSDFDIKNKPEKELLAIAPDYSTSGSQIAELVVRSGKTILTGARNEVINISTVINGDALYNTSATESMFKKSAPDYSILHLAMHGETDNTDSYNSRLIFENGGKGEDGLLNTWEIYNMRLKSALVVLSACNTGTGKLLNGEGVMSLARAFTYAGCPSVVMTLWSVSDLSSTNLMGLFYNNLSDGSNKAEALQKAKIDYISQSSPANAHPYYWAGYVMIGSKAPLDFEQDYKIIYTTTISLGIISVLALAFLIKRRINRKI